MRKGLDDLAVIRVLDRIAVASQSMLPLARGKRACTLAQNQIDALALSARQHIMGACDGVLLRRGVVCGIG